MKVLVIGNGSIGAAVAMLIQEYAQQNEVLLISAEKANKSVHDFGQALQDLKPLKIPDLKYEYHTPGNRRKRRKHARRNKK